MTRGRRSQGSALSVRTTVAVFLLSALLAGGFFVWRVHSRYLVSGDDNSNWSTSNSRKSPAGAWLPELPDETRYSGNDSPSNRWLTNEKGGPRGVRKREKRIPPSSTNNRSVGASSTAKVPSANANQNRVHCMVPFIWTPSALHAYHAIRHTWGRRCHVLRFYVDPVVGDERVGFHNLTEGPGAVAAARKANLAPPHDVVVLHDMRRPWHTCGPGGDEDDRKPAGTCRNIFEKVWRMVARVGSSEEARGAEWFVKVDSDTFLFPENVGRFARARGWSPDEPRYFGHVLNHRRDDRGVSIVAGGAVFLSRAALLAAADAFRTMPLENGDEEEDGTCRDAYTGTEEVVTAVCLKGRADIVAEPAVDPEGRELVSLYGVGVILEMNRTEQGEWWYWEGKRRFPCHDDGDCLAHLPLAFHDYKDSRVFLDLEKEFYGSVRKGEEDSTLIRKNDGRVAARHWENFDMTYRYFERVRAAMKEAENGDRRGSAVPPPPAAKMRRMTRTAPAPGAATKAAENGGHRRLAMPPPPPVAKMPRMTRTAPAPETNARPPRRAPNRNDRLYCMVPFIWTPPNIHVYHAIRKTWGKRCDVLKFMIDPILSIEIGGGETGFLDLRTHGSDYELPEDVVVLYDMERPWNACPGGEDGTCRNVWEKVWRAWVWVDLHGGADLAEWFAKVDADSFLFPENLARHVAERGWSPDERRYFGHVLHHRDDAGPLVAGAAVFFSRAALEAAAGVFRRFENVVESFDEGMNSRKHARCADAYTDQEEVITAVCLKEHLGVDAESMLDETGRELVSVGQIEDVLLWNRTEQGEWWYWKNKPTKHPKTGRDGMHRCCGDLPIAFHGYRDPQWFFKLEKEFYSVEVSDGEGDRWKDYRWYNPTETGEYFDRVRNAMKGSASIGSQRSTAILSP